MISSKVTHIVVLEWADVVELYTNLEDQKAKTCVVYFEWVYVTI